MIEVPLTRGLVALIDDEDAEEVLQHKWNAKTKGHHRKPYFFPTRSVYCKNPKGRGRTYKTVILAVELMKCSPGMEVDHKNGNPLDCQRSNMRCVTRRQNAQNRERHRKGNLVGTTKRENGRWRARIEIKGRETFLGNFNTAEEAHQAYLVALKELGNV